MVSWVSTFLIFSANWSKYCSCLPNAVLIFDGRIAVVRAVQHIPKGAEVNY